MHHLKTWVLLSVLLVPYAVRADDAADIQQLRELLLEIKADYDDRIMELEDRLAKAERKTKRAVEIAEDTAITAGAGQSGANTFNPSVGSVLVGGYRNLAQSIS